MADMGVIGLLTPYLTFGRYSEGQVNIPAKCPFCDVGGRKKPSFYVYVGPSTQDKYPGSSFCHRCAEGWSLVALLKLLDAPARTIDQVQEYLRLITRATRRKTTRDLKLDFKYLLPEALLGQWDFFPKKMAKWGFNREIVAHHEIGFDRLNKRITFPLRDHHGNFVGVSGRASRHWQAERYKVYSKELHHIVPNYHFNKGSILWGLDKIYETRMRGETKHPLVVCEGFKAKLWVEQAGVPHSVAVMGTFITKEQLFLLTCISTNTILFLDHDQPGRDAVNKQVRRLRNEGLNLRIADYDTADFVSPDDLTPEQVLHAVENTLSVRQWRKKNDQRPQPPRRQYK